VLANIPATQTVIEIKAPGGPEMLVPATRPVPEPKAGEVLIRIAGAGVNRADCLQRMGRYPMPPGAPDIPGRECSGTVVKTGEGVAQWQVVHRFLRACETIIYRYFILLPRRKPGPIVSAARAHPRWQGIASAREVQSGGGVGPGFRRESEICGKGAMPRQRCWHAHATLLTLSELCFTVREVFFGFGPAHAP
jgi:NADPH:quinone reductase-like Zn-dependent oxidoreductase